MRRYRTSAMLALVALASGRATAGPPFTTDDPVPTDTGHWEIYAFGSVTRTAGANAGSAGFDLNYGPVADVQLTMTLPVEFASGQSPTRGNLEAGAKLRLLHQESTGIDLAVFPRLFLPTARGARRVDILLPVWAQRDFGKWSVFGGGGYRIHAGAGNRNSWTEAAALTRTLGKRATLGAELYHDGPDTIGGRPHTGVNVGGSLRVSHHISLLASGGPGIENARAGGLWSGYLALKFDY